MNLDTKQLQHLLSSVKYGDRINPIRDWLVLVVASLVLLVLSALWSIWLFARAVEGEAIGTPMETAPTEQSATVETVRTIFDERKAEEERYRNEYQFIDPARSGG